MIEKKDLRKGNLVKYEGFVNIVDSVAKVVGMWESMDGFPLVEENGLPHFGSEKEIFPVKLTSEVLHCMGFIKNNYSIKGVIFWQSPNFYDTKIELMETNEGFNFLDYVTFTEVHTLQNFYQSVTGNELIVNHHF